LNSLKNVDVENGFIPKYELVSDERKKKNMDIMRKQILEAEEVILATDDDREGEAIAWHICDLFDLSIERTKRIVFHEITEQAIKKAIKEPTILDMNKVDSQKERQILDLLVGFTISPLLWKYISKNAEHSLSAGRCQTPALKIIYENQIEIEKNPGKKIYETTGYFTKKCIPFDLKKKFETENDILTFLEESVNFSHVYSCSKPTKILKSQPEPITTSRLQQMASNSFHFSPKETMKIAQKLYEEGYITYMRTDSKKYSGCFLSSVEKYIKKEFKDPRYTGLNDFLSSKENNSLVQGAHEAIRPTDIFLKTVDLDAKEKKLYSLIWKTTLESCMSPAEYYSIRSEITAPMNTKYVYLCEIVDFLGWQIVEPAKQDSDNFVYLQTIKEGTSLSYKKVTSHMNIVEKKLHFTEAKLVQLLEERGIGRPSTFSMLVDKIQEREYVKKEDIPGKKIDCIDYDLEDKTITEKKVKREIGSEKSKLVIQPLGRMVYEFLEKHFGSLFQYEYTREMEEDLDKIAKGDTKKKILCEKCYKDLEILCDKVQSEKKQEYEIDENNTFLIGKFGPVIKTRENGEIVFKTVREDIDFEKMKKGEYKIEDLVVEKKQTEIILGKYKGDDLIVKKGKYGLYAVYGENKKTLTSFGNRPLDNIKYEDVLSLLSNEESKENKTNIIRKLNDNISIRKGQYGDYIFYKTTKMKKPNFYKLAGFVGDYKNGNIEIIKNWIKETYQIGF